MLGMTTVQAHISENGNIGLGILQTSGNATQDNDSAGVVMGQVSQHGNEPETRNGKPVDVVRKYAVIWHSADCSSDAG